LPVLASLSVVYGRVHYSTYTGSASQAKPMAPHTLPVELTSFVGRQRDLAELEDLLPQVRMLTLSGPGGVGKTRLAIRLASRKVDEYPDGVFMLQLASTSEPDLVPHVLAATLGVREEPGQALLETIIVRLNQGRILLLLDNCEHLADSVASLAQALLEGCTQLQILATSRESLNVPGEFLWQLEGLPDADALSLFVDRARHVRRSFDGLDGNSAIAEICRLLDGLPLAIELAAAQVKVMGPAEIRTHLDDRLRLLVAYGMVEPRHASLKATLDWSYDLLAKDERTAFRRLSVFPASFDLSAAAIACDVDLLSVLTRLVAKSMVVATQDAQGMARYHLLDTMRYYGRDRLQESGDQEEMEERFIRHFSRAFDAAAPVNAGSDQKAWLARIDRDYENLRGVLALSGLREPETMVRLAAVLVWFWFVRGYWTEGIRWTDAALSASPEPRSARARLLAGAVGLARLLNRYDQGRTYGEESLRLHQEIGDEVGRAETLFELGWLALPTHRFDHAETCFEEVLRVGTEQNSIPLTTRALFGLGQLRWRQGRLSEARRYLIRCQIMSRSVDNARINTSDTLGHVFHDMRQLKQARRYFRDSHDTARMLGDRSMAAHTLMNLALVDIDRQDPATVRANLESSLRDFVQLGQRLDVSVCLDGFALLAAENQIYERALRLFAAAAAIRHSIGAAWSSGHTARVKAAIDQARMAIGPTLADRSWNEGKSMTLEQAVKHSLANEAETDAVELSRREREVAALVGEGMSSSEIAARLKIAERTVDSHAEHIRNKLGLRSRAQIAAWAVRELLAGRSS
jgi:predicted ATPase/DNA-binding CsgD family transcriptional regulator